MFFEGLNILDLWFILALITVIAIVLICGAVLFLCYKWRQEEVDEEAARRVVCLIKARPKLVKKWLDELAEQTKGSDEKESE